MTTRGTDDDLIARIETLEKIVKDLCTQPLMSNTSQRGGTYTLYPVTGNNALEVIGIFNTPTGGTTYGHSFYDANQATVLSVANTATGLIGSTDHSNFTIPNPISFSATSWTTLCEHEVVYPPYDMIRFSGAVIVPASTTIQFRLFDGQAGSAIGSVVTKAGSYNGSYICSLIHPWQCGWGDTRVRTNQGILQLQAQLTVTTGGNATIYPPRSCQFVSSNHFAGGSTTNPLSFS